MRISDWSSDVCSSDLVSEKAATDAGLDVDQSGYPTILQTANGAIEVRRSNIAVLEIGPLKAMDLGIVVAPAFGDINVLGMNFLSQLKSWRVEGDWMRSEEHTSELQSLMRISYAVF